MSKRLLNCCKSGEKSPNVITLVPMSPPPAKNPECQIFKSFNRNGCCDKNCFNYCSAPGRIDAVAAVYLLRDKKNCKQKTKLMELMKLCHNSHWNWKWWRELGERNSQQEMKARICTIVKLNWLLSFKHCLHCFGSS